MQPTLLLPSHDIVSGMRPLANAVRDVCNRHGQPSSTPASVQWIETDDPDCPNSGSTGPQDGFHLWDDQVGTRQERMVARGDVDRSSGLRGVKALQGCRRTAVFRADKMGGVEPTPTRSPHRRREGVRRLRRDPTSRTVPELDGGIMRKRSAKARSPCPSRPTTPSAQGRILTGSVSPPTIPL